MCNIEHFRTIIIVQNITQIYSITKPLQVIKIKNKENHFCNQHYLLTLMIYFPIIFRSKSVCAQTILHFNGERYTINKNLLNALKNCCYIFTFISRNFFRNIVIPEKFHDVSNEVHDVIQMTEQQFLQISKESTNSA